MRRRPPHYPWLEERWPSPQSSESESSAPRMDAASSRHCPPLHAEAVDPTVNPTSEAAGKGWTPASRHASARGPHSLGPLLLARSHGASRADAGWRDRLPDSVHVLDVHDGPLLSRRATRATDSPFALTAAPARWGTAQHGVDDRASRIHPPGAWTAPLGRWPAG